MTPTEINHTTKEGSAIQLMVISYSLSGGGSERFTSTLISALNPSHYMIHLVLLRGEIDFPLPAQVRTSVLEKNHPFHVVRTILRLRKLISSTRPDVILSTAHYPSLLVGVARLGVKLRARWIVRFGGNPNSARQKHNVLGTVTGHLLRQADEFVANDLGLARRWQLYYNLPVERTRCIHNPADFVAIDLAAGKGLSGSEQLQELNAAGAPVILAVGRLELVKGHRLLLNAFARIAESSAAELWICGTGSQESELIAQARALGIGDRVHFLGFQLNPYGIMSCASLFVMSSLSEGLPNALIEAQGLGLPAVATACSEGIATVVKHKATGILTSVGNETELAEAIQTLLRDHDQRVKMGLAARKRARKKFNLQARVAEWEAVLREK